MKKLLMTIVLLPLMALAATETINSVTWTYAVYGGEATIEGATPCVGALMIPATLGGAPVTWIEIDAFKDCRELTAVTISENVLQISEGAFSGCTALADVKLPTQLGCIEENVFAGCISLKSIAIPDGVTEIGSGAFSGCTALARVVMPSSLQNIDESAFEDCSNMDIVFNGIPPEVGAEELSAALTFEGWRRRGIIIYDSRYANEWCDYACVDYPCPDLAIKAVRLDSKVIAGDNWLWVDDSGKGVSVVGGSIVSADLIIPAEVNGKAVTSIGREAFYDSAIKSVEIPGSVKSIGAYAFGYCRALEGVNIFEGVTTLRRGVFRDCRELKSIRIPSSVTSIGAYAFEDCESLTELTIPAGVRQIGAGAFGRDESDYPMSATLYFEGAPPVGIGVCMGSLYDEGRFWDLEEGEDGFFHNCIKYNVRYQAEWKPVIALAGFANAESYLPEGEDMPTAGAAEMGVHVYMTVSNVVAQYIFKSIQPQFAVPASSDIGFVNIVAEVKGGVMSVPESWAAEYPKFTEKFGTDFTKALAMQTGKKDGAGNPMFVWQDYVAGTDPTDETDVFTASITIVDGKVKVSYSPELDDARKALRKYTIWGKKSLMDTAWTEVEERCEAEYNFFRVTVEMR